MVLSLLILSVSLLRMNVHCFIVDKNGRAVDIDPRNHPDVKHVDISKWDEHLLEVYSIDENLLTDERKYRIDEFISTHRNAKYDWFDCILLCLNMPPDRDNHYNCQSFLSNCLRYSRLSCHAIKIKDFKRLNYLKRKW